MPHERRQFANGEVYHVTVRRIGNELFFGDIHDYYRGIFSIYEFNNSNPVSIQKRRMERARFKKAVRGRGLPSAKAVEGRPRPLSLLEPDKRDKLLEIWSFSLMPNHIHLLLKQIQDNGISRFMQKHNSGYATYFKEKYKQKGKGHFFQDRFTSVHVKTDRQLEVVFVYIHANPISLIEPKWKEIGIKNPEKVLEHLANYRWSSYSDYIGKENFPSVTEREFMLKIMGGEKGCRDSIEDWVRHKGEIREFSELALEN